MFLVLRAHISVLFHIYGPNACMPLLLTMCLNPFFIPDLFFTMLSLQLWPIINFPCLRQISFP